MIFLKKLIKDNNIKLLNLYNLLNISRVFFNDKLILKSDFKIRELEYIKDYFVSLNIVKEDFDIGDFLNEV